MKLDVYVIKSKIESSKHRRMGGDSVVFDHVHPDSSTAIVADLEILSDEPVKIPSVSMSSSRLRDAAHDDVSSAL